MSEIGIDEKLYWLAFSAFPGIGPVYFGRLLKFFGSAKTAWEANIADLERAGMGALLPNRLIQFRQKFSPEKYSATLKNKDIDYLTLVDKNYPSLLAGIKNPPFVIYTLGGLNFSDITTRRTIAVVGTRKATSYGAQITRLITGELADAGAIIVSGLALGVDTIAHETALEHNGITIAVLGSGVDLCYPRENERLYRKIIEHGGSVVSELPPGSRPHKGSFPSRNRIIAGLSEAVIVTEGDEKSGALITANQAFLNKRLVFAIPGQITSTYSRGPNMIISNGAVPVISVEGILQTLSLKGKYKEKKILLESKEEKLIVDFLRSDSQHINQLIKLTGIPADKIGGILSLMEIKAIIKNNGQGIFALADI